MARLSTAGVLVTPEHTESEGRSNDGADAMAGSNTRERNDALAKTEIGNTTSTAAMGQNESRETIRQRNAALHRAGKKALLPISGKLPRRSDPSQRRLVSNPLTNIDTFDVPDDEEPFPIRKRTLATRGKAFSPLKRHARQRSRDQTPQDLQPLLDAQFGNENIVRQWMEDAGTGSSDESAVGQDDVAATPMQSNQEQTSEVVLSHGNAGQPDAIGVSSDPLTSAVAESNLPPIAPKRKPGRPSKAKQAQDEHQPTNAQLKRKRGPGRPSNAQRAADARRMAAEGEAVGERGRSPDQVAEQIASLPLGTTMGKQRSSKASQRNAAGPSTAPTSATKNPQLSAEQDVVSSAARLNNAASLRRSTRQRDPEAHTQATGNGNAGSSSPRVIINENDEPLTLDDDNVEQPEVVRPEELDDVDDGNHNDLIHAVEEQPEEVGNNGSSEDESERDDDVEHGSEDELDANPLVSNGDRFHGQWHKFRGIMCEVAKHRGSTARIRDEEFKNVLQGCTDAVNTVRATPSDVNQEDLYTAVSQCETAIAQARSFCSNGNTLGDRSNKRRGIYIYRHLMPALAKLLKAAVEAFERVDGINVETDQISLDSMSVMLQLMSAVVSCGENANANFLHLSRPVKQEVHRGITVPLRELHTILASRHREAIQDRDDQQRIAFLAREFAEMEERRQHQAQRRNVELRNQAKWKRLNSIRLGHCLNSSDIAKMNHLRSCGMQLVKTDADGQPFLPSNLRDRAGYWSMPELWALERALRAHADVPDPLNSQVFEKVINDKDHGCAHGSPLANRNVLEIVLTANGMKDFYTNRSTDQGTAVHEWVRKIPRWIEPPIPTPTQDDIEHQVDRDEIE